MILSRVTALNPCGMEFDTSLFERLAKSSSKGVLPTVLLNVFVKLTVQVRAYYYMQATSQLLYVAASLTPSGKHIGNGSQTS